MLIIMEFVWLSKKYLYNYRHCIRGNYYEHPGSNCLVIIMSSNVSLNEGAVADFFYLYECHNCICAFITFVFVKLKWPYNHHLTFTMCMTIVIVVVQWSKLFLKNSWFLNSYLCCKNCATIITAKGLRACRCGMSENLTFTMRMTIDGNCSDVMIKIVFE